MKRAHLLALASTSLLLAAQTDAVSAGAAPDPVKKADPAPAPQTADQVTPAQPQPDPSPNATGNAEGADPNPPETAEAAAEAAKAADAEAKKEEGKKPGKKGDKVDKAAKTGEVAYMVWAQPGHETIGIGQLIKVKADEADDLRAAGRARHASEAEIEAGAQAALDLAGS